MKNKGERHRRHATPQRDIQVPRLHAVLSVQAEEDSMPDVVVQGSLDEDAVPLSIRLAGPGSVRSSPDEEFSFHVAHGSTLSDPAFNPHMDDDRGRLGGGKWAVKTS